MEYLAREKLLDKSCGSIYKLVNLAAMRALEISEGKPALMDVVSGTKPSTTALYEIADGKIECKKAKAKD